MMETAHVGEVALRAPQPTHIDVHIHQESALAQLLLAGCSALRLPESASTRSLGSSRLLVASWAMMAGSVAFLHKKRGGTCWALLRTLLVLMNFCMSVAAIVLGACEFNVYRYYLRDDVCVSYSSNHWPTKPPNTPGPEEADRIGLCIFYTSMLKTLLISLQAMLLGVWVLLLLASLTPVCVYFWKRCFTKMKTDEKKLLGANVI
ncbi:transmembrane protein 176A isoform X2 [Cricetulus griseus]|uniref:Transmembrane protein 176A isoform X2 n=1 Tax=Cricetulus griseus TaxID=10029 RepID=A0A9J7H4Q0_CRIGR|nr:transmembrane protein 176A isoform X2 [Cricetulus griseus]XP_035311021.1 transmembrane protein 176A isoform X2 [Cricetulus griseus]